MDSNVEAVPRRHRRSPAVIVDGAEIDEEVTENRKQKKDAS